MADPSRKIEMLLKKAWTLVEARQVDLGLKAFDEAIAAAPESDAILVEKGVALFRAARPEEALAAFEAALSRNPGNMVARANGAKALLHLGRREDALAAYEAGLALEPDGFGMLLGLGSCLLELGRPDDAIERFTRAARAKPREAEPWFRTGLARRAKGDLDGALAALQEACANRPKYVEALRERARVLLDLARPREAWPQVLEAVKAAGDGSTIDLLCLAGAVALAVDRPADALACAEKAIKLDKDAGAGWALKARAQERLGNAAGAALSAGTAHMVEGRLDEALEELDRAVAADPRYGAAWCNRAVVLERAGRFEDALASYDRALELDPGAAVLWHNKGNLLYSKLGRREEALRCYKREIKLDHRRWFELPPEVRSAVDQLG